MQQLDDDPFSDVRPSARSESLFGETAIKTSSSPILSNERSVPEWLSKFRNAAMETRNESRPVWPELTKPGGLVSSTCVDSLMTGKQEAILMNQLLAIDDSTWEPTLRRQVAVMSDSIPIHVNERSLEQEGVSPDEEIESPLAGLSLATRLMIVLKRLNLTFHCKAGHIEISTNRGGITRIYDVSPLVDGIRGGLDQLENNIMKTVEPDIWDIGGGSSTIAPHVANGTKAISTLIVVAPTPAHLQLQALLDRLNQLGSGPGYAKETHKGIQQTTLLFDNARDERIFRFDDRVIPRNSGFE